MSAWFEKQISVKLSISCSSTWNPIAIAQTCCTSDKSSYDNKGNHTLPYASAASSSASLLLFAAAIAASSICSE